jgi:hypothetical protein
LLKPGTTIEFGGEDADQEEVRVESAAIMGVHIVVYPLGDERERVFAAPDTVTLSLSPSLLAEFNEARERSGGRAIEPVSSITRPVPLSHLDQYFPPGLTLAAGLGR